MYRYRVLFVVFSAVVGISSAAYASNDNVPVAGARQFMFGFSGWNVGSYQGGAALRVYTRDNLSLRLGLDFAWLDEESDMDRESYSAFTQDTSEKSIGVSVLIERHFEPGWNVVPLVAGGIGFHYADRERYEYRVYYDEPRCTTSDRTEYSLEARFLGGAQWHFTRRLGLGAEYYLSLKYTWTDAQTQTVYVDEEISREDYSGSGHTLALDASRLWLSIGF